jgi:hypothetical protein
VVVRYINLPTSFLYTNSLTALESSLVESFIPFSIGVDDILQFVMLNLSSKLLAYFVCETKMLLPVFHNSTPIHQCRRPKSLMSKVFLILDLICFIILSPLLVIIISTTYMTKRMISLTTLLTYTL